MKGWSKGEIAPDCDVTPYVHWWNSERRLALSELRLAHPGSSQEELEIAVPDFTLLDALRSQASDLFGFVPLRDIQASFGMTEDDPCSEGERPFTPLPEKVRNPAPSDQGAVLWTKEQIESGIGELDEDTVIVAVIDDAIPFAHPRFRLPNTENGMATRFLAGWLQGAVYVDGSVPFGNEFLQRDIENLMNKVGRADGDWLDEDAFNRAICGPDPVSGGLSEGALDLMGASSHGAAVLDIACGADPRETSGRELSKTRIIAVGLPPRRTIGMAGTYLEFYAIEALKRIIALADRIWEVKFPNKDGGFPLVINLSYGQQSGSKAGDSIFERTWRKIRNHRKHNAPTHLVMPAGNENLLRCNARWNLRSGQTMEIPWRILPEDQTANFVEIWTDPTQDELEDPNAPFPLKISLVPPGERAGSLMDDDFLAGEDRTYFDHPNAFMRTYCERNILRNSETPEGDIIPWRYRYVIAMRSTLSHTRRAADGRAGLWQIALRFADGKPGRQVYANVQVDQDPRIQSRVSQRSYFDNDKYRAFAPSGRPLDSYAYLSSETLLSYRTHKRSANLEPANVFGWVTRKGTQNSLANSSDIFVIAGHRMSDGRQSDFSATFLPAGAAPEDHQNGADAASRFKDRPFVSFPVDAGPNATGVRAAGPQVGSTQVVRGTSTAAPQAVRWIVNEYHQAKALDDDQLLARFEHAVNGFEKEMKAKGIFPEDGIPAKLGKGRMMDMSGRPSRLR